MTGSSVWLLLVSAFGAEVIGTMGGFGAATILTPVAAWFLDMKTAIALVACFHLFGNASRLVFFGRHIAWSYWVQFGLIAVLCSALGARAAARLSSPVVTLLFGAFLLVYVILSLSASDRVQLPRRPATLVGGGMLSGLIAGLLGTGGAVRSACLLAFGLPKEVYIGTSASIALVVDATRLPIYVAGGLLPAPFAPLLLALVVVAFGGSWLGQRLVRRISAVAFRRFVLALLALMGVKLVLDGWHGLG